MDHEKRWAKEEAGDRRDQEGWAQGRGCLGQGKMEKWCRKDMQQGEEDDHEVNPATPNNGDKTGSKLD